MKVTIENIIKLVEGFEPVQIDGIPEGFSFRKPSYKINGIECRDYLIVFIPLSEMSSVVAQDEKTLLDLYKKANGKK